MYCVNCGIKLADTEHVCPLCGVRVYHPDLVRDSVPPLYPPRRRPLPDKRSHLPNMLLTAAFVLSISIVLLCDWQIHRAVTWSGFVVGALILSYVSLILPTWFQKPNPVIFVPCAFAALTVYLLYIDLATGGSWFLKFAFPTAGGFGLIVTAVVTLLRYVRKGKLYILGGAFLSTGGFTLLVEWLATVTFDLSRFIGWSLYPLVTFAVLGGLLIFLAIYRPAREMMERKFFI